MRPWAKFFGDPITAHHLLTNCPKFYQLLCGSNPLTTVAKSKGNLALKRSLVGQINAFLMPPPGSLSGHSKLGTRGDLQFWGVGYHLGKVFKENDQPKNASTGSKRSLFWQFQGTLEKWPLFFTYSFTCSSSIFLWFCNILVLTFLFFCVFVAVRVSIWAATIGYKRDWF